MCRFTCFREFSGAPSWNDFSVPRGVRRPLQLDGRVCVIASLPPASVSGLQLAGGRDSYAPLALSLFPIEPDRQLAKNRDYTIYTPNWEIAGPENTET